MKKNTKVIILVITLIAIVALAYVLTSKKPVENSQVNLDTDVSVELNDEGNTEGEDVATDEGELEEVEFDGFTEISVPDDYDWRESVGSGELEVEYMTDDEKALMKIAPETRVQVLDRDEESGVILAYKVIKSDEDIETGSQE